VYIKQVLSSLGMDVYPHMPILRPHCHVFRSQRIIVVNVVGVVAHWSIRPILGFWGAKFTKMGDFLPRWPMNLRAKFDATSFILSREIH